MTEEHESDSFVNFLKAQNPTILRQESVIKIMSYDTIKRRKKTGAKPGGRGREIYQSIVELDLAAYKRAISSNQVFVGYDCCSVYDAVDIVRCFKCSGFNHTSKSCRFKMACPKCSGEHAINDCNSEVLKCANCYSASRITNVDVAHAAWDRACPIYQQKLKMFKGDILGLK